MNSTDAVDDVVSLRSSVGAAQTVDRFKTLLSRKGITLFAQIDHALEAAKVGLSLRPTQLLIFGNPNAGTPLMQSRQTIGLDLPLRVLIWEDEAGQAWLTYHPPKGIARRHGITGNDQIIGAIEDGLAGLVKAAATVDQ